MLQNIRSIISMNYGTMAVFGSTSERFFCCCFRLVQYFYNILDLLSAFVFYLFKWVEIDRCFIVILKEIKREVMSHNCFNQILPQF